MEHLIFWSLNVSVFNDTDLNVSLYKYKRLKTHLVKQNCLVILTNKQTNLWSTSAADTNLMNVEMTKYATKHKIRLHCYFHCCFQCYSWKGEKRRNRWLTGLTENIDWMHMRHHKEQSRRSRDNEPSQNENSALTQLFPKPHDIKTPLSFCLHLAAHNLMSSKAELLCERAFLLKRDLFRCSKRLHSTTNWSRGLVS